MDGSGVVSRCRTGLKGEVWCHSCLSAPSQGDERFGVIAKIGEVSSTLCPIHHIERRGVNERGTHILGPELITRRQSSLDIKVGQREVPSSRNTSIPIQAENQPKQPPPQFILMPTPNRGYNTRSTQIWSRSSSGHIKVIRIFLHC